jgi:hypothetical protein
MIGVPEEHCHVSQEVSVLEALAECGCAALVPSNTRIGTQCDVRGTTRWVFYISPCGRHFWAIGHWQCTLSEGLCGQAR